MNVHKKMALLICFLLHVAVLAESSKEPKHTLPYRGMRVPNTDKLFYVTKIESENKDENIEIEIKFNMPLDPRTVQKQSIRINGTPLPPDTLIAFNKAGDKIKMLIRASLLFGEYEGTGHIFQIDLPEVQSFNHIPLYRSQFGDLVRNKEYTFRFLYRLPQKPLKEKHGEPYGEYVRFEDD